MKINKMDEFKILKQEAELCGEIWEQDYQENKGNDVTLNHVHICDFDLVNLLYHGYSKSRAKLREDSKLKCKQYLKSIGKKRDHWLDCCENCIHDRYVTISGDNSTVLNICTLMPESRWKNEK